MYDHFIARESDCYSQYYSPYINDRSICSFSAGLSGSCLWSCSPLWFGSGMDSPCQPPQTLNTAKSCRNGSISSGPSARRWPVSQRGGRLRASSLTYSKILWNRAASMAFSLPLKENICHLITWEASTSYCIWLCLLNTFSPLTCSASSLQRVYPTWPCATAASPLLKPSAS